MAVATATNVNHEGRNFAVNQKIWFVNRELDEVMNGNIDVLYPDDMSADVWNDYLGNKSLFLSELYMTEADAQASIG